MTTTRRPLLTPPIIEPDSSSELDLDPPGLSSGETNTGAETNAPDHLAAIDLDAIERGEDGLGQALPGGPGSPVEAFLSPEAFQAGLEAAFSLGGHLAGLSTLLRAPADPTFPPASRALYDTIRDVPALHFLIKPGGVWIQRAATIGLFAVPVAIGVGQELRARRARPVNDPHRVAEPDDQAADQAEAA
jgi:hypothetical protein